MDHNVTRDKVAILLVGGRSTRMGTDKFLIEWTGEAHWKYMMRELNRFFDRVYISCRIDQQHHFPEESLIIDDHSDIGPIGGIHSAFGQIPNQEELFFVGCDLPYFKIDLAQHLYQAMDATTDICAAQKYIQSRPEPLVAIWRRSSYDHIKAAVAEGNYALYSCMDALSVQTVILDNPKWLHNVNYPADL